MAKFVVRPFPYAEGGVEIELIHRDEMVQDVAKYMRDHPEEKSYVISSGDAYILGVRDGLTIKNDFEVYSFLEVAHGFSFRDENGPFMWKPKKPRKKP